MIYPTKLQITLWLILATAGLFELLPIPIATGWNMLAGALLGFTLFDLLASLRRPGVAVTRQVHTNLPVSAWSNIELHVTSTEKHHLFLRLHDHSDPDFQTRSLPEPFTLVPGGGVGVQYQVKPKRRGLYHFPGTDIFARSPIRLWQKKWFFPCEG